MKFAEYLAEEKGDFPDGTIRWHDKKQCYAGYMGGRLVSTKKDAEKVRAYLVSKYGATSTQLTPKDSTEPFGVHTHVQHVEQDEPEEEQSDKIETKEFEVPAYNLDYLKDQITKLNKTAAKLKCAPIELHVGEPYAKEIKKPESHRQDGTIAPKEYRTMHKVTLTGEAPKLSGWSFIAKREPLEGTAFVMTKTAPGQKLPKKYANDHDLTCDHCKKKARRNATFVVRKSGKTMEVGRSCLRDFLGHADPEKYANWASMLTSLDELLGDSERDDYGGGGRYTPEFSMEEVIAATIHQVKTKGFVSNQYAGPGKPPTSHVVYQHFSPPIPMPKGMSYKDFQIPYTEEDKTEAKEAIAWLKSHPKAGKEEFWTNLSKLSQSPTTTGKHLGYLCAGAMMFEKEKGQVKAKEGIMKTIKKDEGLGKEGDKITVKGVVISAFAYQNDWGTKRIFTVKTDSGHLVKMFTMSGGSDCKKDSRVEISGKIRSAEPETYENSPFKGMMTTTMAPRARIEAIMSAEEADKHFHVGDKIKFRRAGKSDGVGTITSPPVYGKFEVTSLSGKDKIHVSHEDITEII